MTHGKYRGDRIQDAVSRNHISRSSVEAEWYRYCTRVKTSHELSCRQPGISALKAFKFFMCVYRSPPKKDRWSWTGLDWIGLDWTGLDWSELTSSGWRDRQFSITTTRESEKKNHITFHSLRTGWKEKKKTFDFLITIFGPKRLVFNVWKDYLVCQLSVLHDCPNGLQLFSLKVPDSKPTTYLVLMIWMPYEPLCSFLEEFHILPFRNQFFIKPEFHMSLNSVSY